MATPRRTSAPRSWREAALQLLRASYELDKLANLLYNGYSGFLDAHEQMQIDYYAYVDSQGP